MEIDTNFTYMGFRAGETWNDILAYLFPAFSYAEARTSGVRYELYYTRKNQKIILSISFQFFHHLLLQFSRNIFDLRSRLIWLVD